MLKLALVTRIIKITHIERFLVRGGYRMSVSYKKLWKLLIDKDMKKKDLCVAAGISHASMAKLGKNENVTTDVLLKICTALKCDIGDIMEITEIEA